MPREPRKKSSTGIYHIMLRGINRQNIFEDNEDRSRLLERIIHYKSECNYGLYGYCLMDNHIHLLIKEAEESISNIIKRIFSSYVQWYNQKYTRCGHLFQERFKSEPVESDVYLLVVLRYIHQNPIKAGITKEIHGYRWSSYNEYFGKANNIDSNFVLNIFSEDRNEAIKLYQKFMEAETSENCLDYSERKYITDEEIKNQMRNLGINNTNELQKLPRDQQKKAIKAMKQIDGITVRQIARITGIPKSVIDRI